jgi:hypothetical protein
MRITDLQIIPFTITRRDFRNGELLPEREVVQTLTPLATEEGPEGFEVAEGESLGKR